VSGRKGSSGHQNLIKYSSRKLLVELVGDDYLSLVLVREQKLDVNSQVEIKGPRFGAQRVARGEVTMYADIACAAVFNQDAKHYFGSEPLNKEMAEIAKKRRMEGNMAAYHKAAVAAYGVMVYIIECEINPRSNLLRDGPKLTGYRLIKQQNNNLVLILSVFEDCKIDNPGVFDFIWRFPKKGGRQNE